MLLAINVRSVKVAITMQMIFTVAKVGVLMVIVIGGFVKLAQGGCRVGEYFSSVLLLLL